MRWYEVRSAKYKFKSVFICYEVATFWQFLVLQPLRLLNEVVYFLAYFFML